MVDNLSEISIQQSSIDYFSCRYVPFDFFINHYFRNQPSVWLSSFCLCLAGPHIAQYHLGDSCSTFLNPSIVTELHWKHEGDCAKNWVLWHNITQLYNI